MIKYLLKTIFIFSLALSLSSCGSVYKIAHDYKPPKSKKGLVCLTGCQSQLKQCNHSCNQRYKQCAIKSEQKAKVLLPGLLVAYPRQLELWLNAREEYRRDLDWYEFRRDMAESRHDVDIEHCKKNRKNKNCDRSYRTPFISFDRPSFNMPRPVKPTLAREASSIRKASCNNNCGCNSNYRLCYTSCGGVVKSRKVCIKNCGN